MYVVWSAVLGTRVGLGEKLYSEMMAGSPKRLVLIFGTTKIVWVVFLSSLIRVFLNCPVTFRGCCAGPRRVLEVGWN